jgi:hypothetical protein
MGTPVIGKKEKAAMEIIRGICRERHSAGGRYTAPISKLYGLIKASTLNALIVKGRIKINSWNHVVILS